MISLSGKTALVTGAGRGIGNGIALLLAAQGAHVAVNYANSKAEADDLVQKITSAGGKAFSVKADVSKLEDIDSLFSELGKRFDGLDILVNNAGRGGLVSIEQTTPEIYDSLFGLNTRAVFFVTQRAVPMMRKGGRIVNISSVASQTRNAQLSIYAGTKAAVDAFTRTWASELGPRGITVNSVNPGLVKTDMTASLPADMMPALLAKIPVGRMADAEDIAVLVAFLASDEARHISGASINVSGGEI